MKSLAYFIGGLLALPAAAFALAFLVLGEAIGRGSIWTVFDTLLRRIDQGLTFGPWLVALLLCLWLGLGLVPRWRWVGAVATIVVVAASLLEFAAVARHSGGFQWFLPSVAIAGAAISAWIVWSDFQTR